MNSIHGNVFLHKFIQVSVVVSAYWCLKKKDVKSVYKAVAFDFEVKFFKTLKSKWSTISLVVDIISDDTELLLQSES